MTKETKLNRLAKRQVVCVTERKGEKHTSCVGVAFVNADGTISVYLDAFPANGKLRIIPIES